LTRLVVDASAYFPIAVLGYVPQQLVGFELVAPHLLWSETLSALREAAWRGVLGEDQAASAVSRLHGLGVLPIDDDRLPQAAFSIARELGWAKTYDAEYVALARLLDAPLFTRDGRLRRGAGKICSFFDPR